jgi:Ca2+-binding RTX toxin-like protein
MATIGGTSGNDTLKSRVGNDVIAGGEGADSYVIGANAGKDIINNNDTDGSLDVVHFTSLLPTGITSAVRDITNGGLTLVYGLNQVTIPYYFYGADYQIDQFIFADNTVWQANDKALSAKLSTVKGTAGDDKIQGVFDWDDSIDGLAGNDVLNGERGADTLLGGASNDNLAGGDGNDSLQGGTGNDQLYGQQGDDNLLGGDGVDVLIGDEGHDTLNGGKGNDQLSGLNGNDTLVGGAGDDYLDGGIDNDSLSGGAGKDTLLGGKGNDSYYITDLRDTIYDTAGNDTVYVSVDDYKVPVGIENVVLAKGVRALPYFIDSLVTGSVALEMGKAKTLTYSFVSEATPELTQFAPYSLAQQTAVRAALAKYSAVAGVTFVEANDSSAVQLRFFRDDLSSFQMKGAAGFGAYPPDSDVHINVQTQDMSLANGKLTGNFATLLHEIGHALGLKHLFEEHVLAGAEDKSTNTVMSYVLTTPYVVDLGVFDKAALHYLYGINHSVRAGANTYSASDKYIWDGAGIDTLDVSSQTLAAHINLKPGSWNYIGLKASSILAAKQFFIGHGTLIENVVGGSGNDIIAGNTLANKITGAKGHDTVFGYAGNDELIGGEGKDVLIGGTGKDSLNLTEVRAMTDTVRVATGESSVAQFDNVSGFHLTTKSGSNIGVDKLDLPFNHIAKDTLKFNGSNAGVIASHHISHGVISFDDINSYTKPLAITRSNFADVLVYLQANIKTMGDTVVFSAMGNSYVFQDIAANDVLIELTGVKASGVSADGLMLGGVWVS